MLYFKYLGVFALAVGVAAKEMPVNEAKAAELYDSGIVHMSIMERKRVRLERACPVNHRAIVANHLL